MGCYVSSKSRLEREPKERKGDDEDLVAEFLRRIKNGEKLAEQAREKELRNRSDTSRIDLKALRAAAYAANVNLIGLFEGMKWPASLPTWSPEYSMYL